MRKIFLTLAALAAFGIALPVATTAPASAETVIIKKDRGHHYGWRNHRDGTVAAHERHVPGVRAENGSSRISQRAAPIRPAFFGLELQDAFAAVEHVAGALQRVLAAQAFINRHSSHLASHGNAMGFMIKSAAPGDKRKGLTQCG